MGLPWLKLAVDVADHPKIGVLERELTLVEGLGLAAVIRLWCWVARFYPDGTIPEAAWPDMARNALRDVMRTDGDNNSDNWRMIEAPEFVDALTVSGLVERLDGACQLHDWEDFNGAHAKKAEQNRERQRRFRERQAALSTVPQRAGSHGGEITRLRNAGNAPRVDKRREEETTTPLPPAKSAGGLAGADLAGESQQPPPSAPVNGNGAALPNGTLSLPRPEQPRLRKRKRVETLAQATKFELEHVVNERSTLMVKAIEERAMSEGEALAYANMRWPTGPPNERVVALAFEAYAMRAGAAPGGTS